MSCSKASPFTKEEETFIVKKFAVLGSRKAVKRAFIKEFQGVRKSRSIFFTFLTFLAFKKSNSEMDDPVSPLSSEHGAIS